MSLRQDVRRLMKAAGILGTFTSPRGSPHTTSRIVLIWLSPKALGQNETGESVVLVLLHASEAQVRGQGRQRLNSRTDKYDSNTLASMKNRNLTDHPVRAAHTFEMVWGQCSARRFGDGWHHSGRLLLRLATPLNRIEARMTRAGGCWRSVTCLSTSAACLSCQGVMMAPNEAFHHWQCLNVDLSVWEYTPAIPMCWLMFTLSSDCEFHCMI